jgi:hypothetical protein
MSNPLHNPASRLAFIAALVLVAIGGILVRAYGWSVGTPFLVASGAITLGTGYLHDRGHKLRGEQPHALFGQRSPGE